MEQLIVPEVGEVDRIANPDAKAMALTGDMMTDLQSIAKEMGVSVDSTGAVVQPQEAQPAPVTQPAAAPAQPQAAPKVEQAQPPVEVPAKFQNPDGTPNVEKIAKSERSLDEMIAKYRAKEREAQQLQNRVNNPAPQVQQPAQQTPAVAQNLSPLEAQMANDLLQEAAALGVQLDQRVAIAQARVMARGLDAKYQADLSATSDLRSRLEDHDRRVELQGIIDSDPNLLSDQMVERLWAVRQANPAINQSQTPWRDAYIRYLGEESLKQRGPQVQTPNPTGQTAKAPPTPVGPVTRVQPTVNLGNPKTLSDEQLVAEIRKIHPNFRGK